MNSKPIAFIIGPKNEQIVLEYIKEHLNDLLHFKILITATESRLLEKYVQETKIPLELTLVASLSDAKSSGDAEIGLLAAQLSAIFVLNYPGIAKQFPAERVAALCEKAANSDTFICFSGTNVELILNHLAANFKGAGKQNLPRVNQVMQTVLLTRFPSFDLPEVRKDMINMSGWSNQQMSYWLEDKELFYLRPLVDEEKYSADINEETKCWSLDEEDINKIRILKFKSADLKKSIEILTLPPASNLHELFDYPTFERDFLISHHVFTTSLDLMQELIKRYAVKKEDTNPQAQPATAVVNVLKDWILMEYGNDFNDNEAILKVVQEFFANQLSKDDPETAKELKEMLDIALALKPPYPVDLSKAPKPVAPKKTKGMFDFLAVSSLEIARQMTVMDEQMFHKVKAKEFLGGAWTKKDANVRAPNLTQFINHTNRIAAWVVSEILKQTTTSKITEAITKFIQIGRELLELRNYGGVMNILTALHSAPLGKLKNAWINIPTRERKDFEELTEALSLLGHFKNYRDTLKTLPASTACIPLIQVTCSDLNGLGEVFENTTTDGKINWDKHQKVANHIWSIKRFMRARYVLKPVDVIQQYILSADAWEGEKTLVAIGKLRDLFGSIMVANENIRKSIRMSEDLKNLKEQREMTDRDWELLSTGAETKIHGVGEAIIAKGNISKYLYRIKQGSVRIEQNFNGNIIVHRLTENQIFGEMHLFFPVPIIDESVVGDEVTEVVKYKLDFVSDKCRADPALSEKLHRTVARQLSERLSQFGQRKKKEEKKDVIQTVASAKGKVILTSLSPENEQKRSAKIEKKASGRLNPVKKPKKTLEDDFRKCFSGVNDIILKAWNCVLKRGPTVKGAKGVLYLSTSTAYFHADVFGRKIKEKYNISAMREIKLEEKKITIQIFKPSGAYNIYLKDSESLSEIFGLLNKFMEQRKTSQTETFAESFADDERTEEGEDNMGLGLSSEDWDRIMEGTRSLHFAKDDYVIMQGVEQPQRLYQIEKGSCRIEKFLDTPSGKRASTNIVVLGVIKDTDSLFGEISFLEGPRGKSTASVVANEDTVVNVIEGYYLNILFECIPAIAGRFYYYLGSVIGKRLRMRQASMLKKDHEEESEMDGDDDKSEATETTEEVVKKTVVKRTQDLDKKTKKKRKSANRIVIHKDEDSNEKEKEHEKEQEKEPENKQ